jgi:hypothetical protein
LTVTTSLAIAAYASAWLVPVYLIAMAWILGIPSRPLALRVGGIKTSAAVSRIAVRHKAETGSAAAPGSEALTSWEAAPEVDSVALAESGSVKSRRARTRVRRGRPIALEPEAFEPSGLPATWIRVGPGRFVRAESLASMPPEPTLSFALDETEIQEYAVPVDPTEEPCVTIAESSSDAPEALGDVEPDGFDLIEHHDAETPGPSGAGCAVGGSEPAQTGLADLATDAVETSATTSTNEPDPAFASDAGAAQDVGPKSGCGDRFEKVDEAGVEPDTACVNASGDNGTAPEALGELTPGTLFEAERLRDGDSAETAFEPEPSCCELPVEGTGSPSPAITFARDSGAPSAAGSGGEDCEPRPQPGLELPPIGFRSLRRTIKALRLGSRRRLVVRVAAIRGASANVRPGARPRVRAGIRRPSRPVRDAGRSQYPHRTHQPRSPPLCPGLNPGRPIMVNTLRGVARSHDRAAPLRCSRRRSISPPRHLFSSLRRISRFNSAFACS